MSTVAAEALPGRDLIGLEHGLEQPLVRPLVRHPVDGDARGQGRRRRARQEHDGDAIAGAELVSVPEAGHMVIMEKPAAVAKAVELVT